MAGWGGIRVAGFSLQHGYQYNYKSDARELPKKEQITFRTRQKLKNKNIAYLFVVCILKQLGGLRATSRQQVGHT